MGRVNRESPTPRDAGVSGRGVRSETGRFTVLAPSFLLPYPHRSASVRLSARFFAPFVRSLPVSLRSPFVPLLAPLIPLAYGSRPLRGDEWSEESEP